MNSYQTRGFSVDRQFREHTRKYQVDPEPYRKALCTCAARAFLENKLDNERLRDVLTDKGNKELECEAGNIVTMVGNAALSAGAGAIAGTWGGILGAAVVGGLLAPFTGGASLAAVASVLVPAGAVTGTVAAATASCYQYQQNLDERQKQQARTHLSAWIATKYTTSQVLDYFLATNLLLSPDGNEIFAVDVYSGYSSTAFSNKCEQIKGYSLQDAFPGWAWGGHYILWWKGCDVVTRGDAMNAVYNIPGFAGVI
jgi:hypothetical protein